MGAPGLDGYGRTWAMYEAARRSARRWMYVGMLVHFVAGVAAGAVFL